MLNSGSEIWSNSSLERKNQLAEFANSLIIRKGPVMILPFDLQEFILRARVLKLYRQALRTARRAPVDARGELKQTIRQEMENNRDCKDKSKIRFLLSEGLERLKGLDEMLDMQGRRQ